jgi:hypothetical protein
MRLLVRLLGMFLGGLTMLMSCLGVLLTLVVLAVFVVMNSLPVMVCCGFMVASGIMMVLAGVVLHSHTNPSFLRLGANARR